MRSTACWNDDQMTRNCPLRLLLDEEIDDRLELLGGHVGGVFDLGEIGVFQIERGLLAGGGVIVLERDVALEFRIEQRGVGVERAGLLRQIGEGIALQHRRNAVQLVLIADEVEPGRTLAEKFRNVAVAAPGRKARGVERLDQVVVDERLLHAANDVDHVVARGAAAGDQHVENGRGRIADRDQIDVPAVRRLGEQRPIAARIADADVGEIDRTARRARRSRDRAPRRRLRRQKQAQP